MISTTKASLRLDETDKLRRWGYRVFRNPVIMPPPFLVVRSSPVQSLTMNLKVSNVFEKRLFESDNVSRKEKGMKRPGRVFPINPWCSNVLCTKIRPMIKLKVIELQDENHSDPSHLRE